MSSPTEAIREQLMAKNAEYQRLREQHIQYAAQLDQLESKTFLSETEQLEETRLKKLKLRTKDLMESLIRQAQAS